MRKILILCVLVLVAVSLWLFFKFKTENHFGAAFTGAPKVEFVDLIDRPSEFLGKKYTIEGKVANQCPKTGCFFYFHQGSKMLRIELGDLDQKIPKRPGAVIVVEGQLVPMGESYQFLATAAEFK